MKTRAERRWAVIKDVVAFSLGMGGIVVQQLTGQVYPVLTVAFMAMTGIPALTNLVSVIRSLPTGSGPSSSPPPGSSTVPESSSPN